MPNPGRAFVGTRRYAILFTCSAQPPIVTKEYRHVTLTADHARNFTSCVRQASCHRPHGKLPMSSVSAWSRRSVPSRMQPRPAGLYDSPLEGGGFEPSVPGAKEPVSFAEGELRGIERGRPTKVVSLRGTDGSNPSPSSGESGANLTSLIRAVHWDSLRASRRDRRLGLRAPAARRVLARISCANGTVIRQRAMRKPRCARCAVCEVGPS